jgi:hypothetical protein
MNMLVLAILPERLRTYDKLAATAIHEAGHAAMAFQVHRGLRSATIVPDAETGSLGAVCTRPVGPWFRPDLDVDRRVRNRVEEEIMMSLAGSETQAAWTRQLPDRPRTWQRQIRAGATHDRLNVVELSDWVTGSDPETGSAPETIAYIRWLTERSRNAMGPRYWRMVGALAGELLERRTMSGAQIRATLQRACLERVIDRYGPAVVTLAAPQRRPGPAPRLQATGTP